MCYEKCIQRKTGGPSRVFYDYIWQKKVIKEEDTTNQKVQSRKDINLLESFMTIYGNLNESFRDMKILESIKQE